MPTHYQGTPEQIRALNAFIKLNRAVDSLMARLSERGSSGDLTPTQFGVMETLYHLGPLCPGELSQKLLKSTGNMTLVIDNLEKRGLVSRNRSSEDRRMIQICLTPAGQELIAQIFPHHAQSITEEMNALTPQEQDELGRLCKKLGIKTTSK